MSDVSLDIREHVAHIDRAIAESHEFTAEQQKLFAEQQKLTAESQKPNQDRAVLPWTVAATLLGAGAALFAAGAGFIKLIGG